MRIPASKKLQQHVLNTVFQLIYFIHDKNRNHPLTSSKLVSAQRFPKNQITTRPLLGPRCFQIYSSRQSLPHKLRLPVAIPTIKNILQLQTFHALKIKNRKITSLSKRLRQRRLSSPARTFNQVRHPTLYRLNHIAQDPLLNHVSSPSQKTRQSLRPLFLQNPPWIKTWQIRLHRIHISTSLTCCYPG